MKKIIRVTASALAIVGVSLSLTTISYAANNTNVTQTISSGTLVTDIRDASRVTVASPTFAMTGTTFSFNCQTTTGTIGSAAQRLYVDNPGAANAGYTLTLAATGGATALWNNAGTTQNFDFNDPTTAGCTDGADADAKGGQLTVNPAVSTLTADCSSCTVTGITKGASTAYSQAVTDSVTLLTAAAGSDDIGRWYLTGIGLSQTLPGEQPNDSYTINLTATVTAS
jgi:hypothetical protein